MPTRERHCMDCGAKLKGTNPDLKCPKCKAAQIEQRKMFDRLYHRARSRAVSRTIKVHSKDFNHFMDEELVKVSKDQDAVEFVRAARARAGLAPMEVAS